MLVYPEFTALDLIGPHTFLASCINCLRTLPYVKAWNTKYKDSGLIVIGVHTPESPFEKDESNVRKAVHDLGITYPVAMDNR
jgi:hypothetical protein